MLKLIKLMRKFNRWGLTVDQITKKLNAPKRSIYRDIDALKACGAIVVNDRSRFKLIKF